MNRRHRILFDAVVWTGASVFLALALATTADAATASAAPAAAYTDECGDCHVPYPAQFLAAQEWSSILGRLDRHYGVDASLDPATLAAIAQQLHAKPIAGAGSAPLPRITTSRWYLGEHRELGAAAWKSPAVRSASNCAACHAGAARGVFSEREVALPPGLISQQTREDEHEHDD